MAPEPIFQEGPVATPFVYTVSGTGEVTPRACAANYDGSGAGGDFIPALIFRSQAGHVISRAILQSTITAGDDAEVSWFPGVKAGSTGSATGGLPNCVCSLDIGTGTFTNGTHYLPITTLSTDTPSVFSTAGGGTPNVDIGADGFYMIAGRLSINPQVDLNFFVNLQGHGDGSTGWTADLDVIPADNTRRQNIAFLSGVTFSTMTATDTISISFQCDLGISGVTGAGMEITQLGTTRLF